MLRITVHDSRCELRLHLEGRLAGAWVREVELCWRAAQASVRNRIVIVDLRDVDFVDLAGERLLAAMHRHGAKLVAAGLTTKHLVSEITGHSE